MDDLIEFQRQRIEALLRELESRDQMIDKLLKKIKNEKTPRE